MVINVKQKLQVILQLKFMTLVNTFSSNVLCTNTCTWHPKETTKAEFKKAFPFFGGYVKSFCDGHQWKSCGREGTMTEETLSNPTTGSSTSAQPFFFYRGMWEGKAATLRWLWFSQDSSLNSTHNNILHVIYVKHTVSIIGSWIVALKRCLLALSQMTAS